MNRIERLMIKRNWLPEFVVIGLAVLGMLLFASVAWGETPNQPTPQSNYELIQRIQAENVTLRRENNELKAENERLRIENERMYRELCEIKEGLDRIERLVVAETAKMLRQLDANGHDIRAISADVRAMDRKNRDLIRYLSEKGRKRSYVVSTGAGRR